MGDVRVGKRYARALFQAALKYDVVRPVEDDLGAIVGLLRGNDRFRQFILSPHVPRQEKLALAEKLFSDRVTALTMQALRLLLEKRREEEIETVEREYVELRREHEAVVHAVVTSSEALEEDQRRGIVSKIEQITGKRVEPEFRIDPHLIGGVRVQYENFVLDGTLRGELRRIRERLLHDVLKQS